MTARLVHGWLVVGPYTGAELTTIEIAYGRSGPGDWKPAFLDWVDGQRVAMVRPTEALSGQATAWIRISGVVHLAGRIAN